MAPEPTIVVKGGQRICTIPAAVFTLLTAQTGVRIVTLLARVGWRSSVPVGWNRCFLTFLTELVPIAAQTHLQCLLADGPLCNSDNLAALQVHAVSSEGLSPRR